MQPHTGAVVTVLNYLAPTIKALPQSFSGRSFVVRSTIYSAGGHFLKYKYHDVRTGRHSEGSRVLEFEVGKDYTCFLEVRYNAGFDKFDFIKHRHTYVREEFTVYRSSENFTGEYVSESGHGHRITGRKLSQKRLEFHDTFRDDRFPGRTLRLKYDLEII